MGVRQEKLAGYSGCKSRGMKLQPGTYLLDLSTVTRGVDAKPRRRSRPITFRYGPGRFRRPFPDYPGTLNPRRTCLIFMGTLRKLRNPPVANQLPCRKSQEVGDSTQSMESAGSGARLLHNVIDNQLQTLGPVHSVSPARPDNVQAYERRHCYFGLYPALRIHYEPVHAFLHIVLRGPDPDAAQVIYQ